MMFLPGAETGQASKILLTKTKKRKEVQYFISITLCNKKAFF
jgi:hypothetical protein